MAPLLRRNRRPEGPAPETPALPSQADPEPPADAPRLATGAHPVVADGAPEPPAGVAPEDAIGPRPDTRRRGRLRRRLRHLRRVRELMLRDVGGLVYEIHRTAEDTGAQAQRSALVQGKLERLVTLDLERRQLEDTLGDRREITVVREPGVGGTCPGCGDYFPSDARFCARCGTRVDGRAAPAAAVHDETPGAPAERTDEPPRIAPDAAPEAAVEARR